MTLHSFNEDYSNHQCPKCGAYYIPFAENIACPKCGFEEHKKNDFIELAVNSMNFNLIKYKSYSPPAWYISCYSDHALNIAFGIFEKYREENGQKDFKKFVENILDEMDFSDQEYAKKHTLEIILAMKKVLDNKK